MIKRSTWILLVVLAFVIGAYFFIKNRPVKSTTPTPTVIGNSYLLSVANDKLQSLRVFNKDQKVTFIERDTGGAWKVSLPSPQLADQAQAEAAETQVGALQVVLKLQTSPELSAIGLDNPAYTITLKFQSGATHTLQVGSMTPTGSGYYVRYDQGDIYVISADGINALTGLVDNPPYSPTPTPEATLQPTDTSTAPEATATP